jgi:hypothetical protein
MIEARGKPVDNLSIDSRQSSLLLGELVDQKTARGFDDINQPMIAILSTGFPRQYSGRKDWNDRG